MGRIHDNLTVLSGITPSTLPPHPTTHTNITGLTRRINLCFVYSLLHWEYCLM
jgi:hypothetical protein